MVTQDAKNGFTELLNMCLSESILTPEHKKWKLQQVNSLDDINENEIIILTISSFNFRIFLILHFTKDTKTTDYVAKALKVSPDNINEQGYYDYLGELGNAFCGVFKRELGQYIPHLGMSTPNRMASDTLKHLETWKYDHIAHFLAKTDDGIKICGSIYVSTYGEVDFKLKSKGLDESVDTGALELF